MMNRLRSFSQGKKELREENKSIPTVPSKEDIISTIDGFGNRIEGKQYFPIGFFVIIFCFCQIKIWCLIVSCHMLSSA